MPSRAVSLDRDGTSNTRSLVGWLARLNLKLAILVTCAFLLILAAARVVWKVPNPLLVLAGVILLVCSALVWNLNRNSKKPAYVPITQLALSWVAVMALVLGSVFNFDRAGWIWLTLTGYDLVWAEDLPSQINLSTVQFAERHQFFALDPQDSTQLVLRKGQYAINETIVVPQDAALTIEPGTVLRFAVGRSLISYSPIVARGTENEPIVFTAQNEWLKWGVVGVVRSSQSIFQHVQFKNGRRASVNNLDFTGTLSLIETAVQITDSQFQDLFGKDGVYARQTQVFIRDNIFRNTYNDCLDLDGGGGEISHNQFIDCGDNGIDLSENQHVQVFDNTILDARGGRKGIAADNNLDEIKALNTFGYSPTQTLAPLLTKITVVEEVAATVETDPVPHSGDAADDPAIWIHPTNPTQSTIIGTDKKGGLGVYDLSGKQLQYLPDGNMNNVDLRTSFPLGGKSVALVTAGNRSNDSIAIYQVNPPTRQLENVAARTITTLATYGSCMYHSPSSGKYYYFVNSQAGEVEQWELYDNGSGKVDALKVRSFSVGSQTEGCVADDQAGYFYIGEEAIGIWKYAAEPNAGTARTLVDTTGIGGHLKADVEGLTLTYGDNGTGYLIASSQGDSTFAIYRREGNNPFVKTFKIVAGNGIDAVSGTDGIDVTTVNLGAAFPYGVFVAQDGANDNGNQNFKLVPWRLIMPTQANPTYLPIVAK
ncbi:MAG: phytase [Chloroflexi bacterium]|nr:phytase [Chloroflexota bacterium]